jgi:RIO kinase 1
MPCGFLFLCPKIGRRQLPSGRFLLDRTLICQMEENIVMNSKLSPKELIDADDFEIAASSVNMGGNRLKPEKKVKRSKHAVLDELIRYTGSGIVADEQAFTPTFTSSRNEREWILTYLGSFYDEQLITDVLARVKGGKEANVYCCHAFAGLGVELIAAKIYRPRMLRNLRNDSLYREGRSVIDESGKVVRDERALHAVRKGSTYGKELSHVSWLGHEYHTLEVLFQAGADVPRPLASGPNTILMEYLGEVYNPAPTLHEVRLSGQAEARRIYERLIHNVDLMLSSNLVHGDLSAFNVLYWDGEFRIIDFPQAIDPRDNRNSFAIFRRDVARLCQYFERYGIVSRPDSLARHMWREHGLGDLWAMDNTDWEDQG